VKAKKRILQALSIALLASAGPAIGLARAEGTAPGPPHLSQGELEALVSRASAMGAVESAEAVASSPEAASRVLDSDSIPPLVAAPSSPVDIVVMHGRFTDVRTKIPPGTPSPSGTVVAFTVDAATGRVAASYLGGRTPDLSSQGAVERWTSQPAGSTAASASRVLPRLHVRHRRHRARAASWGEGCSLADNHHCYSLAEWSMGGSEEVEGTETEQKTTNMNVPGYAAGDFVDNEEWASFPGTGHWVEIGQSAGELVSCCSLFWFYAFNGPNGYYQYTAPPYTWEVTPNTWNNYGMQSIGNGVWCFDVGPSWEQQVACEGGFPTYSKLLQDGLEVAAETKPVNAGSVVANATFTNGTIHTWKKDVEYTTTRGLCVSRYTPVNYPGNINYGTC
jgi:hypothetical protein